MPEVIKLTAVAAYGRSGHYVAQLTGREHGAKTFKRSWVSRRSGSNAVADVDDVGVYEVCDIDKRGGKTQSYCLIVRINDELHKIPTDRTEALKITKEMDAGRTLMEIVSPWLGCKELREAEEALAEWQKFRDRYADAASVITCFLPHELGGKARYTRVERGDATLLAEVDSELERLRTVVCEHLAAGKHARAGFDIVPAKEAKKIKSAETIDTAVADILSILSAMDAATSKKVLAAVKKALAEDKETVA